MAQDTTLLLNFLHVLLMAVLVFLALIQKNKLPGNFKHMLSDASFTSKMLRPQIKIRLLLQNRWLCWLNWPLQPILIKPILVSTGECRTTRACGCITSQAQIPLQLKQWVLSQLYLISVQLGYMLAQRTATDFKSVELFYFPSSIYTFAQTSKDTEQSSIYFSKSNVDQDSTLWENVLTKIQYILKSNYYLRKVSSKSVS